MVVSVVCFLKNVVVMTTTTLFVRIRNLTADYRSQSLAVCGRPLLYQATEIIPYKERRGWRGSSVRSCYVLKHVPQFLFTGRLPRRRRYLWRIRNEPDAMAS